VEVKIGYDGRALSPICESHRQGCAQLFINVIRLFYRVMLSPLMYLSIFFTPYSRMSWQLISRSILGKA
jgi:hypothetical protein